MKIYSSINTKTLGKLLKRYKLKTTGKEEILKASKIRSTTWSGLNRLARNIVFKESVTKKKNK